jgi:hypothetical protein
VILAFLLAAAAPQSVIEAERAFAAAAQTEGQWTAFRANAAPEAVMFAPDQVNAQQWLKDRADPRSAVMWWPARAWLSCDGKTAATTGPWVRNGGKLVGYFTTIWAKQPDGGWKWVLDHGDALDKPRPAGDNPIIRRASCDRRPAGTRAAPDSSLRFSMVVVEGGGRRVTVQLWNGRRYVDVIDDRVGL